MLRYDLTWQTRCVDFSAKRLAQAAGEVLNLRPAVSSPLFVKILRWKVPSSEFARGVWVSRVLLLREQLKRPRVRQLPREIVGEYFALKPLAMIGMFKGRLAIRLHRRKRVAGGARTVRGFTRGKRPDGSSRIHVPHLFPAT